MVQSADVPCYCLLCQVHKSAEGGEHKHTDPHLLLRNHYHSVEVHYEEGAETHFEGVHV